MDAPLKPHEDAIPTDSADLNELAKATVEPVSASAAGRPVFCIKCDYDLREVLG